MITKHVTCLIILISKKINLIAIDLNKHEALNADPKAIN